MWTRREMLTYSAALAGSLIHNARAPASAAQSAPDQPIGAAKRVPFGAAVRPLPLAQESAYRAALRDHCQQLTPEGVLCWEHLRPTRQQFRFSEADAILAFAEANRMATRGHTLVWYGAMPAWAKEISSAREAERELVIHIERVMEHYRGRIKTWHVLNEPIADANEVAGGLRPSVWLRYLGERYIDVAFRTARQVDPSVELVINEYDIESVDEGQPRKRQAYLQLIRKMLERDLPLQGVGIQAHLRGELPIDRDGVYDLVSQARALGLAVHVTELDIIDDKLPGPVEQRDAIIAARAHDLLEAIFSGIRPAAVACWGLSDRYTWVPIYFKRSDGLPNRSLPLDHDYRPKPLWQVIDHFCASR
jgi:endo-1,4-beta-xylanase